MRKTVRRREVKAKARRKWNLVIDARMNAFLRVAGFDVPITLGVPKRRKA